MPKNIILNEQSLIKVDNGEFFEGNLEMWRDCFFSNPTIENITDFCKKFDCKLEIINE